jgi:hypothetical protein
MLLDTSSHPVLLMTGYFNSAWSFASAKDDKNLRHPDGVLSLSKSDPKDDVNKTDLMVGLTFSDYGLMITYPS